MANYIIKEMPVGMGNGKKGRIFLKMQAEISSRQGERCEFQSR
jgi:hypothetical protein